MHLRGESTSAPRRGVPMVAVGETHGKERLTTPDDPGRVTRIVWLGYRRRVTLPGSYSCGYARFLDPRADCPWLPLERPFGADKLCFPPVTEGLHPAQATHESAARR